MVEPWRLLRYRSASAWVHQRANQCVSDPTTVVLVNQQINVTDLEVDSPRERLSLSMKAVTSETT